MSDPADRVPADSEWSPLERGVFVNRTLNLRSIKAIGYDMDYTLVHYRAARWEERAFHHARERIGRLGWQVDRLDFDASKVIRGLAIDLETGNLVKATRFGYVIRAAHGTRFLDFDELRSTYQGTFVDLAEERFVFINVLFGLSEASLYSQLVDQLDSGAIPPGVGYDDLYDAVREALGAAHQEGDIKEDIVADPEQFIVREPETVLALQDQLNAGNQLMLITNSEWEYAERVMSYAFDTYLDGGSWRDLFDTIIVSADKPAFFTSYKPVYRVVDERQSLLSPHYGPMESGSAYYGGCASIVEGSLGLSGDQILYIGDHLFGDVHSSKAHLRWRTALILRELETELRSAVEFWPSQRQLAELMATKQGLEQQLAGLRLQRQRARAGYVPGATAPGDEELDVVRSRLAELDEDITPLAIAAGELRNEAWGPLMRAGIDKSLFARQVERYADVYTSRVSNLLAAGPYALLRAARVDLPHDTALRTWARSTGEESGAGVTEASLDPEESID